MSDYQAEIGILRGQMASMLASNEEQFIYVLSEALSQCAVDDLIKVGELSDEADKEHTILSLRAIADAIESGSVS